MKTTVAPMATALVLLLAGCASSAPPQPTAATAVQAACLQPSLHPTGTISHFLASDGSETVEAYTVGTGTTGVILVHQLDQDLCEWEPYMAGLAAHGYRVMAVSTGAYIDKDVVAAVKQLGAKKVVLIGASKGGAAVVAAASETPVTAVVSLSGAVDFLPAGVDLTKETAPIVFYESKGDSVAGSAETMNGMVGAVQKSVDIIPGAGHGIDNYLTLEPQILAFIAKTTA